MNNDLDDFFSSLGNDEHDEMEEQKKNSVSMFDEFQISNIKATLPTLENLNEGQREAFDNLVNFVLTDTNTFGVLTGPAGTGKSYLIEVLVQHFVTTLKLKVAITGTTNRSVKILKRKTTVKSSRVVYSTLHKLLGIRIAWDDNGNEYFASEFGEENKINDYDVIIIDESSQMDNKLFELVNPWAQKKKIIFCGDKYQTPPVKHKEAIPILPEKQEEYNMAVSNLTKVQRQSEGSSIISLSQLIIHNIYSPVLPIVRENTDDITYFNQTQGVEIMDKLKEIFVNDAFKANADYAKVCCWMNATVAKMNYKIRALLFPTEEGEILPKIMIGEKLVADNPILDVVNTKFRNDSKSILFNTSDEFEVKSYEIKEFEYMLTKVVTKPKLVGPPGLQTIMQVPSMETEKVMLKYYNAVVSYTEDNIHFVDHVIKIIHEDAEALLKRTLLVITTNAKKEKNREVKNSYWAEKRNLEGEFANVIYNYAITVHKAQGGTYNNCVVLEVDIMKNNFTHNSPYERNRIFNTAITRPSEQLYIIYKS